MGQVHERTWFLPEKENKVPERFARYFQSRKTARPAPERPLYRHIFLQVAQSLNLRLRNKIEIVKFTTLRLNSLMPGAIILFLIRTHRKICPINFKLE